MNVEDAKYVFFTYKEDSCSITHYPLQSAIIDQLKENSYVYCFDEVGSGKTINGKMVIHFNQVVLEVVSNRFSVGCR